MRESERRKGRRPLFQGGIAAVAGLALLLGLTLLPAAFAAEPLLTKGWESWAARAALLTASWIAGVLACRGQGAERMAAAGVCAGGLSAFLLVLGVFTNHAGILNISTALSLLCVIFGVFLGCALSVPRRRSGKRRR